MVIPMAFPCTTISGKPKLERRGWNLEAWMLQVQVEVQVEVLVEWLLLEVRLVQCWPRF